MFSIRLQTATGMLNNLICVVHFSSSFNSVFQNKRFMKLLGTLAVYDAKKKEQTVYLEYSKLITKMHYVSP